MHRPPIGPSPGWERAHDLGFHAGSLLMVLIVGLLIVLIVMLARRPTSAGAQAPQIPQAQAVGIPRFDPAVEEVRMRYARGEITEEEFGRLMTGLGRGSAAAT